MLGLEEKRVQFTPDLMPADILDSEVLDETEQGHRQFRFVPGPVVRHDVPRPFHVLAGLRHDPHPGKRMNLTSPLRERR